ncbi:MAG: hypothetical protein ACLPLP_21440 [Mycobacterium sp.]
MAYKLQFDVSGVTEDVTPIDDATPFNVQWKAQNLGPDSTGEFRDHVVIRSVAACPGDDNDENSPVVYDSDTDPNLDPGDLKEEPIAAGGFGPVKQASVGPFPAGSIRISVTLDADGTPVTTFDCIKVASSS